MSDFNVVLSQRAGLGRIYLCGCDSVHLKVGPVTVCLAPEAFAQTAKMIREAMEQLAKISASKPFEEEPAADATIQNHLVN